MQANVGQGLPCRSNRPTAGQALPYGKFSFVLLTILALANPATAGAPFAIEVVDDVTGRGVPLVELRTVNDIRLVTDSRGIVAFDEPGLMGQKVFFHVRSHGHEFPKDGFGFRGRALDVTEGGRARLPIRRINIAERLYRVTGAGIYRDSVLVGDPVPTSSPLLNAQVLGSDSVLTAVFGGKVHWFWGDTNRPGYPLGNFGSPTASSALPADGGLDIEKGVNLDYAVAPDGFAAPSAALPGPGPTWLDGLTVLKDGSGRERMFAAYAKVRPSMEAHERGLAEFDPATRRFTKIAPIPLAAPVIPSGHPFLHTVNGVEYVYFADPYPLVRVRAVVDDLKNVHRYEAFTCLQPGSVLDHPQIDRAESERSLYAWRRAAPAVQATGQAKLVRSGAIDEKKALFALQDGDTGRKVIAHRGSVYWNAYRNRWVMIAVEQNGASSFLGEVWFAEADTPIGPWVYARKVLTHDKYSFYNPKQHPMFARENGRMIYFEGTYTTTFSGNDNPTPRYDYNQILYKLDLADPRLHLPVPIYRVEGRLAPKSPGHPIPFFALDRPGSGTIPIGDPTQFHALPLDAREAPATTTVLYASPAPDGSRTNFTTESGQDGARPVARVWRNPLGFVLPAE